MMFNYMLGNTSACEISANAVREVVAVLGY